jgi:hypothetical protein
MQDPASDLPRIPLLVHDQETFWSIDRGAL